MHPLLNRSDGWNAALGRVGIALLVLLCAHASAQSASEEPEVELFRSALQQKFGLDPSAPDTLTLALLDPAQVSSLIANRLPRGVRTGLRSATGVRLQVAAKGADADLQFGLLSLTYSDAPAAAASGRLLGHSHYLRRTKIATAYGTHRAGKRVFLALTENAGDEKAVAIVSNLQKILRH